MLQCDGWSAYEGNQPKNIFMSCLTPKQVHPQPHETALSDRSTTPKSQTGSRLRQVVGASQSYPIVERITKVFKLPIKKQRPSHPMGKVLELLPALKGAEVKAAGLPPKKKIAAGTRSTKKQEPRRHRIH